MLAVIDNYDSFTFNLVQYLGELGANVQVFRNDQISIDELAALSPTRLLLSPGPGRPEDAGITLDVIDRFAGVIPILGVCLGHQCIGQYYGSTIVHAKEIMHGKLSPVFHQESGVFSELPSPLTATRYHSLVIKQDNLPDCLEITSWTLPTGAGSNIEVQEPKTQQIDEIMGVRHKTLNVEGVQFHPESIASENGHAMLKRFLEQTTGTR